MSYAIVRGAAHANAMRADRMRTLAVRLAGPLAQCVEAAEEGRALWPADPALQEARVALADAREAGLL